MSQDEVTGRIRTAMETAEENHEDVSNLSDIESVSADPDCGSIMVIDREEGPEIFVDPNWATDLTDDELEAVMVHMSLISSSDYEEDYRNQVKSMAANLYYGYCVEHELNLSLPEDALIPNENGEFDNDSFNGTISNVDEKSFEEIYEELDEIMPEPEVSDTELESEGLEDET